MSRTRSEKQAIYKVTLIGALLDAVLGLFKVVVGFFGNSTALMADGVHSFSDVATDAIVLWMARMSHDEADDEHPYGHQRFETFGTVVLGALLIFVAGAIAYDSLSRLFTTQNFNIPGWPVLIVAVASILSKEWIYQYTHRVGKKANSELIKANAWHSRTDAISSVVVLIGALAAMLGVYWADVFAALLLAVYVAAIGWKFMVPSAKELVDTGIPVEQREAMMAFIKSIPGVLDVHDFRSRKMADDVYIDVHLAVNADISVSEGHQIGAHVENRIKEQYPKVQDLVYHIDIIEENGNHALKDVLPLRQEVLEQLAEAWKDCSHIPHNDRIYLHYVNNGVHVEVFLPMDLLNQNHHESHHYLNELRRATQTLPWLKSIRTWYGEFSSPPSLDQAKTL